MLSHTFELALQYHRAGRLAEAEALYRQVLAAQPNHPDALHFLGLIARQTGRHDLAVESIRKAIILHPNNPAAHFNLALTLRDRGQLEGAVTAFHQALKLKPDFPDAHTNLGIALAGLGRFDESIAAFRGALQIKPDSPEAHNNLGNALRACDRFDEAVSACKAALSLKPDFSEAELNLGAALAALGQLDDAMAAYRRALRLKPYLAEAHNNLGNALKERGNLDEAVAAYRRALESKPDLPEAHNNLGNALRDQGHLDDAIAAYHRALARRPAFPEACNNLGDALRERGHLDEAVAVFHQALALKPGHPEAQSNLGNALREQGHLDAAITAYGRALALNPLYAEAYYNLGVALTDRGQLDEAIAAYRRALDLQPDHAARHSNLILALHLHPGYKAQAIFEEHERWNRRFGDPLKSLLRPHPNDRDSERRLKIGYVSADFRDHPVGRYVLPLFERHDRGRFEILCYSGTTRPDWMTDRLRVLTGKWRETIRVPDTRLAEMIREDAVDILVDLSLHTAGNRLPVFARQPAPVQVAWLGYPGSTGLSAIAYRLTDALAEPLEEECAWSAEERVRLPGCWCCYQPVGVFPEINALPALSASSVTFGSLNNFAKINDDALNRWARLLDVVKGSRLLMRCPAGHAHERVRAFFDGKGIATERVELAGIVSRGEYLRLYHRIDIALDPFPYNGTTTTCDALWMGVPVLTSPGSMPAARAGLSILSSIGLSDLAAPSEEDFIQTAERFAGDLPRLAELRATMRARMLGSPLMDAPRFARNVEAAYRAMWHAWCAGDSSDCE